MRFRGSSSETVLSSLPFPSSSEEAKRNGRCHFFPRIRFYPGTNSGLFSRVVPTTPARAGRARDQWSSAAIRRTRRRKVGGLTPSSSAPIRVRPGNRATISATSRLSARLARSWTSCGGSRTSCASASFTWVQDAGRDRGSRRAATRFNQRLQVAGETPSRTVARRISSPQESATARTERLPLASQGDSALEKYRPSRLLRVSL